MKSRLSELDAIRGIAILAVVLSHYTHLYDRYYGHDFNFISFKIFGLLGVELFFILSGFVIFFSIEGQKSAKTFLIKRFIRLYPTYWICVTITFTLVLYFGLDGLEVSWNDALINLTMFQQLFGASLVDRSYWTLIPELFFYLTVAGLLITGFIENIRILGPFWMLLAVIHTQLYHIRFVGLFLNLDYAWFFYSGILIYQLRKDQKNLMLWVQLLFCIIMATLFSEADSATAIGTVGIFSIFVLFHFQKMGFLQIKLFIFLGKISYAWYLLHQNVGYIIINLLKPYISGQLIIIIPTVSTAIMAYLVTNYFEKYVLTYLKNRLVKGKVSRFSPAKGS